NTTRGPTSPARGDGALESPVESRQRSPDSRGVLPRGQDRRIGRLLDLLDADAPEEHEPPPRVHDASPAQLGDPPQLSAARPAPGAQEPRAPGRHVAQPHAAPVAVAEPAREAQRISRGIAAGPVPRSAEITGEAEQERAGEPEPTAPLTRAEPLPRLAAR